MFLMRPVKAVFVHHHLCFYLPKIEYSPVNKNKVEHIFYIMEVADSTNMLFVFHTDIPFSFNIQLQTGLINEIQHDFENTIILTVHILV